MRPERRDAEQDRELRQIVMASKSSFLHGMRVLPAGRRYAIYAVYAFCREVDDIVDGAGARHDKARRLDAWEAEIDAVFAGRPATAIGRELARAAPRYELPKQEFDLILDGMRMDLDPIVAPSHDALERYVRRVAGAVGLLSLRIFGAWRGAPSERFALSLARAMQFTNILRDVEEDAAIGRIYLPREILSAAEVEVDPRAIAGDPNLPRARQALGREARAAFRDAAREVPAHGRLRLVPALLMMGPYDRLLRQMEAGWRIPPARPGWRKALDGIGCVARGGSTT